MNRYTYIFVNYQSKKFKDFRHFILSWKRMKWFPILHASLLLLASLHNSHNACFIVCYGTVYFIVYSIASMDIKYYVIAFIKYIWHEVGPSSSSFTIYLCYFQQYSPRLTMCLVPLISIYFPSLTRKLFSQTFPCFFILSVQLIFIISSLLSSFTHNWVFACLSINGWSRRGVCFTDPLTGIWDRFRSYDWADKYVVCVYLL